MDDKISVLPDEILVKILSYVPTKVAVSTSILSKRWEFLWMWLPKLDYTSSSSKLLLGEFINKNLPLHRAPVIESLRLDLIRRNPDIKPENVRQWVEIAVARHICEMEISYHSKNDESMFPSSLFTCNSLLTLKLRAIIITDVPSVGCLPSLKALQLDRVRFIDQDFLQDLLSICPVLEDLSVHCDKDANMKEFTIIVPSLQSLSLFIPNDLLFDWCEINTPSLKYFKLEDWNYFDHYILIRNMPKLREAYVDNKFFLMSVIESITSVKRLTICSEEDGYGDGFVFNQLEHLELCVCKENTLNLLCQMLKDSPNLRVLDISVVESHRFNDRDDMVCWNQPSSVPECLLSSLQIFNWSRYFGRPQDREIAVYILKNARQLKTATILADTEAHDVPNLKMIKELTLSNRASSSCELVFVEG